MKVETKLQIISEDLGILSAVKNAIEPDNREAPKEVEITVKMKEGKLIINVVDREGNILRLRNTVDDLCEAIETALSVIQEHMDLKID